MKSGPHLDSLTSLRFFAAAAIFALHSAQIPGFPTSSFGSFTLNHGVSFFYVLSGFILHYNYRDRQTPWLRFVALRFFRIWPLHVFGLALALALRWSDVLSWVHAYLSPAWTVGIVMLLQAWSTDNNVYFAINGVSWSISVEMFFYVCFLPLCVVFRRKPLIALLGAAGFHLAYLVVTWNIDAARQAAAGIYSINPAFRLLEFVIGIAACEAWMRLRNQERFVPSGTASEILAVALVLFADYQTPRLASAVHFLKLPAEATVNIMCVDPFFALLLIIFASGRGAVSKAMSWKPLLVLGEVSFAIYLVHQPIQWYVSMHFPSIGSTASLCTSIIATLFIATGAHYIIERPIYAVASAFLAKRPAGRLPQGRFGGLR